MNLIKHKKDKISIILILWAISLVLVTLGLVSSNIEKDKIRINEARNLLKIGEYSEAQEKIKKINLVAAKKLKSQIYIYELLNNGEFLEASEEFSKKFYKRGDSLWSIGHTLLSSGYKDRGRDPKDSRGAVADRRGIFAYT